MDLEKLLGYLREARDMAERGPDTVDEPTSTSVTELRRRSVHIGAVIDQVILGVGDAFRTAVESGRWHLVRRYLDQAIYAMDEGIEIQEAMGPPDAPTLRADALHPTVWDACASLWRSEHRRDAVNAAAVAVNAALQNRLGRRDVSNTELVRQAFTRDAPELGKPRLRLIADDGSETYRSIHDGAMQFGAGCFMAIRNTGAAHELGGEPPEHEALEQLAAFSILARWIERAYLETADE